MPTCITPRPKPRGGVPTIQASSRIKQVVGREQQAAEDHAQGDDVGADAGEVHFQQGPAHRPEVAAGADDGPGRKLGTARAASVVTPDQRQQPSAGPQPRLADLVPHQQHGVEHGQREQHVVGPQPEGLEQQPAGDRAPMAADVDRLRCAGKDERAGRVGRIVTSIAPPPENSTVASRPRASRSSFRLRCSSMVGLLG